MKDIMQSHPIVTTEQEEVEGVLKKMIEKNLTEIVVVDGEERLIADVTMIDLLCLLIIERKKTGCFLSLRRAQFLAKQFSQPFQMEFFFPGKLMKNIHRLLVATFLRHPEVEIERIGFKGHGEF